MVCDEDRCVMREIPPEPKPAPPGQSSFSDSVAANFVKTFPKLHAVLMDNKNLETFMQNFSFQGTREGSKIPSAELQIEPLSFVDSAAYVAGKKIVLLGLPGAFTPC